MRKVAPFSEILSRIRRFPLRKVGVSPKESPGLDRVNSLRTKNKKIRTYCVLINEGQTEKAIRPPISFGNACVYRGFRTGGLVWRPPLDLP